MDFDKRKTATLSALASSVTDKSPKGTVDTPIIPLLTSLNSHPNYFTTSSCSGRISILAQPTQKPASNKKKARGGSWLFISHSLSDPDTVVPLIFSPPPESVTESSELVFRFEPLIIAVECRDVEAASFLVALAIRCGFRESGITSVSTKRVIAGIRCSIRMEVPLGETDNVLVTSEYVKFLVDVANQKMEDNRKRTEGFFQALLENGFVGATVNGNGDPGDGDGSEVEIVDEDVQAGVVEGGDGGGKVPIPDCSASASQIVTVGEPVERIFLWGHTASTLLDHSANGKLIVVFGGFGGMGRHSRRNDTLLLDPLNGTLTVIDVEGAPSPRLGHTASLVGDFMFVIGGRADPVNILDDVWALNTVKMEWKLVKCTGSLFPPRHRHAAAVIGSKIYVFGGHNNGTVSSSLHALDTESLKWEEVWVGGEQPCARHSHTMVAYGSKVFMFGGYNGEKALGDLYSFDVRTRTWKKENTIGRSPHARFSHSMFVHKKFLGIVGGCPFRQHFQELALLDLQLYTWKHATLDCIGKELLVRCTVNVVDNYLVMIGGGAACYAFGTKFSVPFKVNLLPLMSLEDRTVPSEIGELHVTNQSQWVREQSNANNQLPEFPCAEIPNQTSGPNLGADRYPSVAPCWVLQLEKKHGKFGKDILKKFGWLDLGRKVYSRADGLLICFPVTEKFRAVFLQRQLQYGDVLEGLDDMHLSKPFSGKVISLNEMSCLTALDLLKEYGASMLVDEVGKVRQTAKPPLQVLNEAIGSLIKCKGLPVELLDQLPTRWERLGDIVVLPMTSFKDPMWDSIGEDIWPIVARSLNTRRLARQGRVAPTGTRDSTLEILVGHNGWVDHRENGILYSFDTTKCMFSWGNLSEKLRMANLNCVDEVIVDLFAGIGYFVLPFLVRAKAKLVYACEWNPHAVEALKRNLEANSVSDQCIVLEGDNRMTAPKGVADRVCLGLIPSSEGSWLTAVRALRAEGGVLHVHGNVKDSEEGLWNEHVLRSFSEIARSEGHCWELSIEHVERVKWYAPHIRHVVADVRCRQILR